MEDSATKQLSVWQQPCFNIFILVTSLPLQVRGRFHNKSGENNQIRIIKTPEIRSSNSPFRLYLRSCSVRGQILGSSGWGDMFPESCTLEEKFQEYRCWEMIPVSFTGFGFPGDIWWLVGMVCYRNRAPVWGLFWVQQLKWSVFAAKLMSGWKKKKWDYDK